MSDLRTSNRTTLYSLYVALGVVAFLVGIPTFDLTFTAGWTRGWAGALVIAAVLAMGSLFSGWVKVERWALAAVVVILFFYLGAALYLVSQGGEPAFSRGTFAVVLLILVREPVVVLLDSRKRDDAYTSAD